LVAQVSRRRKGNIQRIVEEIKKKDANEKEELRVRLLNEKAKKVQTH